MKCKQIPFTQEQIVRAVQRGGPELQSLIDHLVQALCQCQVFIKTVISYVRHNKGNEQDAEDILQEGLVQMVINLYENKYKGEASIENYAFGVCKFLWNNRRRKNSKVDYAEPTDWKFQLKTDNPDNRITEKNKAEEAIWSIIGQMNKTCKELLRLVYLGFSYQDLGEELNLAEQTVKNKVSGCRKKLRTYIKENPQLKIYFEL